MKAKFRDLRRDLDSGAGPAWPVRSAMRWMTGWRPGCAAGPTGPGELYRDTVKTSGSDSMRSNSGSSRITRIGELVNRVDVS